MGVDFPSTDAQLLLLWLLSLVMTIGMAIVAGIFPGPLERVRKSAFAILILPGLVFALVYAIRGFGTLERALVHWIFQKEAIDSLRIGLVFDALSFAAVFLPALAGIAVGVRKRPSIRMSSAMALSWASLGLAVTAQSLWMAVLAIGIQLFSRTFPLIEGGERSEADDARWIASTKRAWIGLSAVLCGGAGLAAQGVHLDFFSETAWSALEKTPNALVAGGLIIFGLLVMATPALASNALYAPAPDVEENVFIFESTLGWIVTIIFFRLLGNVNEPEWLLTIGIGAAVATVGSLASLPFQTSRGSAIHLWLSSFPVASLMILPFVPAREATLYLLGGMVAFNGLWISLDHRRTKIEIAAAAVFLLGAFGFVGWSTSAGLSTFFLKFEGDPFLRAPVFLILIFYAAFGWRLVLRGGDPKSVSRDHAKWAVLGLFFILGFGPLLSGRFGGGSIPGEPDWIEGAKAWAWIKPPPAEIADENNWIGFGVAQSLVFLSALLGIFEWGTAELFPFAKKYPRSARAAEGLYGLVWLETIIFNGLQATGRFLTERVSARIWEGLIPKVVLATLSGFRKAGGFFESAADPLSSSGFGRLFTPAAKFVQWLHGGNVRLYAWFALIWILIFSVYLTR